jgi:hypothetical protein
VLIASPTVNASFARVDSLASISHRLAGYAPDQTTPTFHTKVDVAAFRRAAEILPPRARYLLLLPESRLTVLTDLASAGRIYVPWAFPLTEPAEADWVLAYETPLRVPPRRRVERRYVLAPRVVLARLAPA